MEGSANNPTTIRENAMKRIPPISHFLEDGIKNSPHIQRRIQHNSAPATKVDKGRQANRQIINATADFFR